MTAIDAALSVALVVMMIGHVVSPVQPCHWP